jgi:hypothetical protein
MKRMKCENDKYDWERYDDSSRRPQISKPTPKGDQDELEKYGGEAGLHLFKWTS